MADRKKPDYSDHRWKRNRSGDKSRGTDDVEETLDRVVSELDERRPEYTRRAKNLFRGAGRAIRDLDERGEEYTQRMFKTKPANAMMNLILKYRLPIFAVFVVLSLFIGFYGVIGFDYFGNDDPNKQIKMQSKVRGDFEVYLPGGSDAEKVLFEMQTNWSTDLATIFVETQNKFDPTDETNITDYEVLKEISKVEEDLNPNKKDQGDEDGIIYVFSIATLIKTLYNLTESFEEAFIDEIQPAIDGVEIQNRDLPGNYSIPEDQRILNDFFNEIPADQIRSLVADVNGDGIYDSALIMMGLSKSVDQRILIDKINEKIEPYFVDSGVRPGTEDTTDEWMERYENGEVHSRMTLTGSTPLARMISDRTMSEMRTVLPWAMLMVAAALLIFHRTWKIWIITLIPVGFALMITYGMMGIFIDTLTPQVVLVAPILIALGVAYGLYIANRYAEETSIKDDEQRIRAAIRTTGKAIFLSAMTTAFGFGSMLTVDMATMQVLGFGLAVGILACYLATMIMTPALVIWLKYKKSRKSGTDERKGLKKRRTLGDIPIRHSRKLVAGGVLFAVISFSLAPTFEIPGTDLEVGGFSKVRANMDYMMISPQDEPVVQKMGEQSDTFGSGQIGLFIVRGKSTKDIDEDGRDNVITDSMKDYDVLNDIDTIMTKMNSPDGIENATGIAIVDIMKMVKVPDFRQNEYYQEIHRAIEQAGFFEGDPIVEIWDQWVEENLINQSYWDALYNSQGINIAGINALLGEDPYHFLINIFYNSMSLEIRGMMINNDYSKTIVYVMMPNMDIIDTEVAVVETDEAIDNTFGTTIEESGNKPSASPLSGFGKVLVTINDVIVNNANQSTVMAILMVFILLALVFKSWRLALITITPVAMVVFWQYFAIWGVGALGDVIWGADNLFSGDLNLFTALIGSIIVGIGVDFSIHITERVREKGLTIEGAKHAVDTSGWTFIESTTTMIMGLTAVFLVNIPSIREFILLIMILLAFSAYAAIFILPSIYRLYLPRYNRIRARKGKS
mgnify:CR=1 FL=1